MRFFSPGAGLAPKRGPQTGRAHAPLAPPLHMPRPPKGAPHHPHIAIHIPAPAKPGFHGEFDPDGVLDPDAENNEADYGVGASQSSAYTVEAGGDDSDDAAPIDLGDMPMDD